MPMRTHYCGEVDESLVGRTVSVAGWVHRRRDHGGVIFVDLRDREGLLQVVFDPAEAAVFAEAERLRGEWVIRVAGSIRPRPDGTANPNLKSGAVELLAREIEVLNRSEALPFQLDEEGREEVRLNYRYLVLRRDVMQAQIERYKNATEIVWGQEEPRNQGAWHRIQHYLLRHLMPHQKLYYAGRESSASPAAGYKQLHDEQQKALVEQALTLAAGSEPRNVGVALRPLLAGEDY